MSVKFHSTYLPRFRALEVDLAPGRQFDDHRQPSSRDGEYRSLQRHCAQDGRVARRSVLGRPEGLSLSGRGAVEGLRRRTPVMINANANNDGVKLGDGPLQCLVFECLYIDY